GQGRVGGHARAAEAPGVLGGQRRRAEEAVGEQASHEDDECRDHGRGQSPGPQACRVDAPRTPGAESIFGHAVTPRYGTYMVVSVYTPCIQVVTPRQVRWWRGLTPPGGPPPTGPTASAGRSAPPAGSRSPGRG